MREDPANKREAQIIKFECNQDMTKLYMTVLHSLRSGYMASTFPDNYKNLQDHDILTEEDYKNPEYVPT